MKSHILIPIAVTFIAVCKGNIQGAESQSKLLSIDIDKQATDTKDLQASASDRTFLIGKDYGYGNGGYGASYGSYPSVGTSSIYNPTGTGYYNRGLNSVYRGYQAGNNYGAGGNTGWGYYGNRGYGNSAYGGLGSYAFGGPGYGLYDDRYTGVGERGYNRWNIVDGGYGGYKGYSGRDYGIGYGSSGSGYGVSTYPYSSNGYASYSGYAGYPSGYRGYS